MTKKAFVELVKKAKMSAKDKAEELAIMAGKPTGTGVAAGAGLATLLAAAGALARSGEDPENTSVLSNPLLLGSLGAAGGYLAGNAFERAPVRRKNKDLSWAALLSLAGGVGRLGTLVAQDDIDRELERAERNFNNIARRIPKRDIDGVTHYLIGPDTAHGEINLPPDEYRAFKRARGEYRDALLRAGREADAIEHASYIPPTREPTRIKKITDWLRKSPYSPVQWAKSLNPSKGGRLLGQIARIIRRRPWAAGAAGLALLAGGSKAIYDKLSD